MTVCTRWPRLSLTLKWPHFSLQSILFFTVCQYSVLRAWRCSLRAIADLFHRKFHRATCRAQSFREIERTELGKCEHEEKLERLARRSAEIPPLSSSPGQAHRSFYLELALFMDRILIGHARTGTIHAYEITRRKTAPPAANHTGSPFSRRKHCTALVYTYIVIQITYGYVYDNPHVRFANSRGRTRAVRSRDFHDVAVQIPILQSGKHRKQVCMYKKERAPRENRSSAYLK